MELKKWHSLSRKKNAAKFDGDNLYLYFIYAKNKLIFMSSS